MKSLVLVIVALLGSMYLITNVVHSHMIRKHFTIRHRSTQTVQVSGVLQSSSGTPVANAQLSFALVNGSSKANGEVTTDATGAFKLSAANLDSSLVYTATVTAKALIANYFYGPTITTVQIPAKDAAYTLTQPIIIADGGYGGFQVTGSIVSATDQSPIHGVQLQLSVPSNGLTYDQVATSDISGSFTISIFGLTGASNKGTLTMTNVIPGYDAFAPVTVTLPTGTTTITPVPTIKLAAAKTCNLPGCQTCQSGSSLKCQTCDSGYNLDKDTNQCQFSGDITSSGSFSFSVNPYSQGKIVTITGAVYSYVDNVVTPVTTGTACFYTTDPKTCLGIGGTNQLGQIYLYTKIVDQGTLSGTVVVSSAGFLTQNIQLTLTSDNNLAKLGDVVLLKVQSSSSSSSASSASSGK